MRLDGSVQQVWVFIGESDRWHGKPLYLAILEVLRRAGCAGGTVIRGLAGFGANSLIHTATLVELSSDLPVLVTFVDTEQRVARVLPEIAAMVQEGLITITPATVVKYTHRVLGSFPAALSVGDVMTREVVTVTPETAVAEVVRRMVDSGVRALPVVEPGGRLAGVVTDGDLLARGALHLPLELQEHALGELTEEETERLRSEDRRAGDVMTPAPIVVQPEMSLEAAAALLARHQLRRVPVVEPGGRLVGVVSRSDLLRTVAEALPAHTPGQRPRVNVAGEAGAAMVREVATVGRETPLAETLDLLLKADERRVVVVDEAMRPVGIITDGDVLSRAARRIHPGPLRSLAAWFAGGARPEGLEMAARNRSAQDVMSGPVVVVQEGAAISEVLRLMIGHRLKLVPVVDKEGRLRGAITRAGLLASLAEAPRFPASDELGGDASR